MTNLKALRLEKNLNMKQVSVFLNLPYTTYVSYEKGDREPPFEMLIKMADFYNTTIDYILNKPDSYRNIPEYENSDSASGTKMVPCIGTIACGSPILAEENIDFFTPVPEHIQVDFALKCKGDSMIGARIFDNDIVYIRKQETVENGEIAAVLIDNEATLKRFYHYGDTVVLRAENPAFKELEFKNDEIASIKILGKAVYFFSTVH